MKIMCLVGKSSSGKDTIYREVMEKMQGVLFPAITFTTRPMRSGEVDGKQYLFVDNSTLTKDLVNGDVIEVRSYDSFGNRWYYYTRKSSFSENLIYFVVCSLEQVSNYITAFGASTVCAIVVEVSDDVRLKRAIDREMEGKCNLKEVCRRFISDTEEWEKASSMLVCRHEEVENIDLSDTVSKVLDIIRGYVECSKM